MSWPVSELGVSTGHCDATLAVIYTLCFTVFCIGMGLPRSFHLIGHNWHKLNDAVNASQETTWLWRGLDLVGCTGGKIREAARQPPQRRHCTLCVLFGGRRARYVAPLRQREMPTCSSFVMRGGGGIAHR
jgi:hypothetical protein